MILWVRTLEVSACDKHLPLQERRNLNPNRSLDRKSVTGNGKDYVLPSFISLLASCFSLVLDVAHLLNNQIKSVQDLMTDLGLICLATCGEKSTMLQGKNGRLRFEFGI